MCVSGDDDEHFAIIIIYAKLNLINVFEQIFSAIIKVSPVSGVSVCVCGWKLFYQIFRHRNAIEI